MIASKYSTLTELLSDACHSECALLYCFDSLTPLATCVISLLSNYLATFSLKCHQHIAITRATVSPALIVIINIAAAVIVANKLFLNLYSMCIYNYAEKLVPSTKYTKLYSNMEKMLK